MYLSRLCVAFSSDERLMLTCRPIAVRVSDHLSVVLLMLNFVSELLLCLLRATPRASSLLLEPWTNH